MRRTAPRAASCWSDNEKRSANWSAGSPVMRNPMIVSPWLEHLNLEGRGAARHPILALGSRYPIPRRLAREEGGDVVDHPHPHGHARLARGAAEMRQQHHVFQRQQL